MVVKLAEPEEVPTLSQWKRTICPSCEYTLRCPQRLENMRLCRDEAQQLETEEGVHDLIKRTLRKVCSSQRKHRRDNPVRRKFPIFLGGVEKYYDVNVEPYYPASYSATLYCSNEEEFKRCLS